MLTSVAPACEQASACPSPVYSQELLVTLKDLPIPPVASTTAGASKTTNAPALAPVAEGPGDPAVVALEQPGDRALGEDLDPRLGVARLADVLLLQRHDLLLQGADQLEAGAVADVGEPRVLVAAEVALADPAVLGAVEQRAPGLELPDPVGRLLRVQLGHPPVVEELAAAHGVAEVHLPVVVAVDVAHRGGDAALGHHGVRLAEQRLADHRGPLALRARLDRRPQPGAARADDDDVVGVPLGLGHDASKGPLVGRVEALRRTWMSVIAPDATVPT